MIGAEREKGITIGSSETLGLEQAPSTTIPYTFELGKTFRADLEPLWEPDYSGPTGKPKRNKSKLKQQRVSRRRNRK